jgi:hypothetical protein
LIGIVAVTGEQAKRLILPVGGQKKKAATHRAAAPSLLVVLPGITES